MKVQEERCQKATFQHSPCLHTLHKCKYIQIQKKGKEKKQRKKERKEEMKKHGREIIKYRNKTKKVWAKKQIRWHLIFKHQDFFSLGNRKLICFSEGQEHDQMYMPQEEYN